MYCISNSSTTRSMKLEPQLYLGNCMGIYASDDGNNLHFSQKLPFSGLSIFINVSLRLALVYVIYLKKFKCYINEPSILNSSRVLNENLCIRCWISLKLFGLLSFEFSFGQIYNLHQKNFNP